MSFLFLTACEQSQYRIYKKTHINKNVCVCIVYISITRKILSFIKAELPFLKVNVTASKIESNKVKKLTQILTLKINIHF